MIFSQAGDAFLSIAGILMIDIILKNPLTLWLRWLWEKVSLERQNANLRLGYMSRASNCRFGNYNAVYENAVLTNVVLGDFSYVAAGCKLQNATIGKFTCIGPDVLCGLGRHPSRDFVSLHPVFFSTRSQSGVTFTSHAAAFEEFKPIAMGHDVWVGARAIILDGVTVGNGAIIGAGAVVAADVPPYAVVGGVPARIIRYRFTPEQIEFLESCQWWDRDLAWLKENYPLFWDVERFKSSLEKF